MRDSTLKLYHMLPAPARSVAASLRGLYLRTWRYGTETDRLVEEALERERWTPAQWHTWQEERLAYVLHRAATQVPYYREYWRMRRLGGDRSTCELLENWPILEKEPVRANARAFIADDCDPRLMFHEHTSGTTGKSIDVWWRLATVRQWYALFEARCRLWYDVSRHDRWAILGGQLVTPVHQSKAPYWVWNHSLNQLYCSSYHLSPQCMPSYLDALMQYRVRYVWGYTSALFELAQTALDTNHRGIKLAVSITNAEPVFDYQREAIEEAFACELRETYGMAEIVAAASECRSGRMHLWPEVGLVELLERESSNGHISGELVCTGLLNADMPLIRYRTGDSGVLPADHEQCMCGRTLPTIEKIEGRMDDLLYTPDGRRIGRLDPVFKKGIPIREAQVVQETLNRLRVRFVPAAEYTIDAGLRLIERLQARVGNMDIVLEEVDRVPRTSNGKFRAVVCNLSESERQSAVQA
jgi:phenylacetate-coenzyme A ligase PaaK-like adenylate-forming protein